jgi:DNA mismatch endonuclease Vsr
MNDSVPSHKRKNMQSNKAKGTSIEVLLGKAMHAEGLRYRKNNPKVYGKPDFTFKNLKIAIFCDGDFWHGKDWEIKKHDHKTNEDFWHAKIENNMKRDEVVNFRLRQEGWIILRFWETDLKNNLRSCVQSILKAVYERKNNTRNL